MKRRRTVLFSFRILGLPQGKIEMFKREVKSAKRVRISRLRDDPAISTLRFSLSKRRTYGDLIRFLKAHRVKKSCYGIWVSLLESRQEGGVHVPLYILKLYEKTGGNLDFSYVWCTYET
jgi:hypothetical protein